MRAREGCANALTSESRHLSGDLALLDGRPDAFDTTAAEEPLVEVGCEVGYVDISFVVDTDDRLLTA
jgi:hypothetical protein